LGEFDSNGFPVKICELYPCPFYKYMVEEINRDRKPEDQYPPKKE
jgi:hypothetical protein